MVKGVFFYWKLAEAKQRCAASPFLAVSEPLKFLLLWLRLSDQHIFVISLKSNNDIYNCVQDLLWTVEEGIFDSVPQLDTLDIRLVLPIQYFAFK